MTPEEDDRCRKLVQDCKEHGYSKYKTTQEVVVEFEIYYQKAYYRVRKHWNVKEKNTNGKIQAGS